ncbi:hypothetical protein KY348_03705 [Candidatus Woesearchaeota archaeon]|nr:hypothetical protein [Candidatus Woesearchaeota archaeon]
MKKGCVVLILIFFLLCSFVCILVSAQNETPKKKRVFTGSVSINIGKYEDYYLRVLTGEPVIYAMPGETTYFKMYVRRGEDDFVLHDVQVLDDNENFVLTVKPEVIKQIRNIDMIMLDASLFVPEDTEPGTYPLRIKVKGKNFVEESYPIDTNIRVGQHTNVFDILFLMIAAALVAIVVYRIINIKKLTK